MKQDLFQPASPWKVYRAVNLTLTILLGKPLSIKLNSNTSVVLFPDAVSCADIWFPTESNFKPYVDEEVKRQHFSEQTGECNISEDWKSTLFSNRKGDT